MATAAESCASPEASLLSSRPWTSAFLATGLISILPLLVVTLCPLEASWRRHQNVLVVFAAGAMLGDVCLHILPHAMSAHGHEHEHAHEHHAHHGHDEHDHHHDHHDDHHHDHHHEDHHLTHGAPGGGSHAHSLADLANGLAIIAGIMVFFCIEKFVRHQRIGHSHAHGHAHSHAPTEAKKAAKGQKGGSAAQPAAKGAHKPSHSDCPEGLHVGGYLNLVADFAHNFTDGLAIGTAFGTATGSLATTLAVLVHEVPHEVGDVAMLLRAGMPRLRALRMQLVTAIGALLGTLVGLAAGDMPVMKDRLNCFTAGGFIYVATVDVIPSLLDDTSLAQTVRELLAMAAGVAIMVGVTLLE